MVKTVRINHAHRMEDRLPIEGPVRGEADTPVVYEPYAPIAPEFIEYGKIGLAGARQDLEQAQTEPEKE